MQLLPNSSFNSHGNSFDSPSKSFVVSSWNLKLRYVSVQQFSIASLFAVTINPLGFQPSLRHCLAQLSLPARFASNASIAKLRRQLYSVRR